MGSSSSAEHEAEVKDILGGSSTSEGSAAPRVVSVARHHELSLARVVLSSEEAVKCILEHKIVEINGIKLERDIEKTKDDPLAFLVLWKGGSAGRWCNHWSIANFTPISSVVVTYRTLCAFCVFVPSL